MMIFKKKKAGYQPQTKIQKRISKLPSSELVAWTENALFVIGKEITTYQRTGEKELLNEAEIGAEVLHEIVKELKRR
jgi:hypothetical protein